MRNKKIILVTISCLILLGVISVMMIVKSNKKETIQKEESPIFMGKILEIEVEEDNKKLLVQGYIRGCEVYEEKILALVSKETEILSNCNDEKVEEFSIGDMVYIELSEAFTKSIPPQSFAKKIQVSKIK